MTSAVGNRRNIKLDGPDFYPTPSWATQALLSKETFIGTIHEPCCGNGAMAKVLEQAGFVVEASDLHDQGFGTVRVDAKTLAGPAENVVTNPPYNDAEELLGRFLEICTGKVALLMRLSFLESIRRYPLFLKTPPSRVYIFSERLSLCKAGETVRGGGTISYGWFIWERGYTGPTCLDWIPPGFKNPKRKGISS